MKNAPLAVIAVLVLTGLAWMFRWSEPVFVDKNAAFTVDRFTGQWWYMAGTQRVAVEAQAPEKQWVPPVTDQLEK